MRCSPSATRTASERRAKRPPSEIRVLAVLLVPLNGIGRGHLTRALIFSEWLHAAGRRPLIALQSTSPYSAAPEIPTTNIPTLYRQSNETAQRLADDLARTALMSDPAVVIEDTHPQPVRWPADIRHLVVVRPTLIDHMRQLSRMYEATATRLLICDQQNSPTWPYDASETAEILSWTNWSCLGPVFRTSTAEGIARARSSYHLEDDQDVFVFSMGGGGEAAGSGDRGMFVVAAEAIARQLAARVRKPRFIFVRGPLFPRDMQIPKVFEQIDEEPELPSLIASAAGAIIRPGYNVTWECIAAGTPFIAIRGTTYREAVSGRLEAMAVQGINCSRDVERLIDPNARAQFGRSCARIFQQFSGSPREHFLAQTEPAMRSVQPPLLDVRPSAASMAPCREAFANFVHVAAGPIDLRLRIDDVTRLDREVLWLISLCRELRANPSLEIVPYHNILSGIELDDVDPEGTIDIGQHGYAHLPQYRDDATVRGEFVNCSTDGHARAQLRLGAKLLERTFGSRFRGGYSAPYDVPSEWLAPAWRSAGGRFLSWIWNRPSGRDLPCVRVSIDPWDWKRSRSRELDQLAEHVSSAIARDRAVGVVLHPQCLRDRADRGIVEGLLRHLVDVGCVPMRLAPPLSDQS